MTDPSDASASASRAHPRGTVRILSDILGDLRLRAGHAVNSAKDSGPIDAAADDEDKGPSGRLGDILDRLDERAFGFLILLLALPCCLPFVYLLPQIVALPMLALAGQMVAGRHHPWLPKALHERKFSIPAFEKVLTRAAKYVSFFERFARPRLAFITSHSGARIIGVLLLIPTASILVPLPSTNTIPGIGVAITALGLIERDGLLVGLGLAIGYIWVGLLGFLGFEAASILKDWVTGIF